MTAQIIAFPTPREQFEPAFDRDVGALLRTSLDEAVDQWPDVTEILTADAGELARRLYRERRDITELSADLHSMADDSAGLVAFVREAERRLLMAAPATA